MKKKWYACLRSPDEYDNGVLITYFYAFNSKKERQEWLEQMQRSARTGQMAEAVTRRDVEVYRRTNFKMEETSVFAPIVAYICY